MSLFWSFWLKRKTKHMALDGIIIKRMPKLQLSGLDIVHDIIPKGTPSLRISQQVSTTDRCKRRQIFPTPPSIFSQVYLHHTLQTDHFVTESPRRAHQDLAEIRLHPVVSKSIILWSIGAFLDRSSFPSEIVGYIAS